MVLTFVYHPVKLFGKFDTATQNPYDDKLVFHFLGTLLSENFPSLGIHQSAGAQVGPGVAETIEAAAASRRRMDKTPTDTSQCPRLYPFSLEKFDTFYDRSEHLDS